LAIFAVVIAWLTMICPTRLCRGVDAMVNLASFTHLRVKYDFTDRKLQVNGVTMANGERSNTPETNVSILVFKPTPQVIPTEGVVRNTNVHIGEFLYDFSQGP